MKKFIQTGSHVTEPEWLLFVLLPVLECLLSDGLLARGFPGQSNDFAATLLLLNLVPKS
jgi:hypothetical protein